MKGKKLKHYSVFSATYFNPCIEIWRFKTLITAIENLRKHSALILAVKSFNIVFWLYRTSQEKNK